MKLVKVVVTSLVLLVSGVGVGANANDYIEHKVYQDVNFEATVNKAVDVLTKKGYQVRDIEVDSRLGKPVLEIEAYKGHIQYDIVLSYPDLSPISERIDD